MADHPKKSELSWSDIERLVTAVVDQITQSGWQPDAILALSRGGFVPATMIAYRLQVKTLAGLDARKNADGVRSTGYIVSIKELTGKKILVVDDGIITGHLLTIVPEEVRSKGGEPRTCALISEGKCPDPDYLVETHDVIPTLPWE
jgi:hypoxanthine phosphoribosyltransferase